MEKVHFKRPFLLYLRERWRLSSALESIWGLPWGLLCGTICRSKLCAVPSCSCHIYENWRGKRGKETLKSSFGVAMKATRRDNFYGKEGFSLYKTVVLKLYCKSYWVLKLYYRILPLFPILLLFYLFCIYTEIGKARSTIYSVPKVYEIITEL